MEWLIEGASLRVLGANLSIGVWAVSLAGSWILAILGLTACAGNGPRRLVRTLRHATVACIVEFQGLVAMVLVDNPERWRPLAWGLSTFPLVLALAAVAVAAYRGEDLGASEMAG